MGFALAFTVAARRLLKRSLIPLVMLLGLGWVLMSSGIFDRIIESYSGRATEETGLFILWPLAIGRILEAPFVGVGVDEVISTDLNISTTPHNGILYVALASGIIPVLFFLAWKGISAIEACHGTL
jgi:O-antigen ligase